MAAAAIGGLMTVGLVISCSGAGGLESPRRGAGFGNELPREAALRGVTLKPREPASEAFKRRWFDGKAELSGYAVTVPRYGELRQGRAALIYVTEELDRRTWIKADGGTPVPKAHRIPVLKLNHNLTFQTGIYPYHVMTSVFSPINGVGRERFAPVKIALSSQEWCGQVHQLAKPTADRLYSQIRSYFSRDGEQNRMVRTPDFTLYEDALLIQLRELDGPFAGGRSWSGFIVPTLWSLRKEHRKASAVPATITRSEAVRKGRSVTRFVLRYGSYERTYEVEKALPRRILRWETNRGHRARLLGTERLAYWKLNHQGGKRWREALGLPREVVGGARAEDPAPRDSPTLPR